MPLQNPSMAISYYGLYSAQSQVSTISITTKDAKKIKIICSYIIIQCICIYVAASTVFLCLWEPEKGRFEIDIIARVMYLYDTDACGYKLPDIAKTMDLVLSNNTYGLPLLPIRHEKAVVSVLSKLSAKTRKCLIISTTFHAMWMVSSILLLITVKIVYADIIKTALRIYYSLIILMLFFDCCMVVAYITDLQQSLTKAMVIRYSGYVQVPGIKSTEDFGGWVPMIAATIWLRGGILFGLNIYCCVLIRRMYRRIDKREVRRRLSDSTNLPFPDSASYDSTENTLYFKAGAKKRDISRQNSIFTVEE